MRITSITCLLYVYWSGWAQGYPQGVIPRRKSKSYEQSPQCICWWRESANYFMEVFLPQLLGAESTSIAEKIKLSTNTELQRGTCALFKR